MNVPGHGEYQLIVSVEEIGGGATEALCAARPRFKVALLAEERANALTQRLAKGIAMTVAGPRKQA
jgi:hypothetical protein